MTLVRHESTYTVCDVCLTRHNDDIPAVANYQPFAPVSLWAAGVPEDPNYCGDGSPIKSYSMVGHVCRACHQLLGALLSEWVERRRIARGVR